MQCLADISGSLLRRKSALPWHRISALRAQVALLNERLVKMSVSIVKQLEDAEQRSEEALKELQATLERLKEVQVTQAHADKATANAEMLEKISDALNELVDGQFPPDPTPATA